MEESSASTIFGLSHPTDHPELKFLRLHLNLIIEITERSALKIMSLPQQVVTNEVVVAVEAREEVSVVSPVQHSAGLPDGVHAPHWRPQVHSLDAGLAGNDRANCRTTSRIVPDHKFAHGNIGLIGNCLEDGGRYEVGGVALVVIDLDDYAFVDLDHVVALVLFGVVRVHCVSHVG